MEPVGVFLLVFTLIGFGGAIVENEFVSEEKVVSQNAFKIEDSLYQCQEIQRLGKLDKPKTIIIEKEKSCPKCKPKKVNTPCGDDRKIFPECPYSKQ